MILRSITVSGWRCHIDTVSVGPFQEGLNVLHGPNATGKSTLFEALLRGLLDGHRVAGKEIEAIRPWGRSLAPTVTIEFNHEETDYRITKRYLDRSSSKLERKENGRFIALAEGNDADDRVRKILSGNAPGRGLAKPEHWGIAQVLWAPQGELDLGALSGELITNIKASLGTQVSGAEGGPVKKRVDAIYSQIFTAGGKLKTGKDAPAIVKINESLEKATERRNTALAKQQQFDEASRRIEDLRNRRAQARRDAEAYRQTLKETRSQAESYRTVLSERNECKQRVSATEAQYNEMKGRIDQIKTTRQELKDANDLLIQLEEALPLQEREVESRQREVASAKAALEDARKGRLAVEESQQLADEANQFVANSSTLKALNERISKIEEARQKLDNLRRQRSDLVAPDAKELKSIRKAIKDRDEAQVRIDSALITLEIVPETDGSMAILEGEQPGTQVLHAGDPVQAKGSPEVVADLPGIARLRAWGPPGSIDEHREAHASAERTLKRLTEPFGTIDLERLEKLNERAGKLESEVSGIEAQIEALLGGRSLQDIEQESSQLGAMQESVFAKHPEWKAAPPDKDALRASAREVNRSFVERVETEEARLDAANAALTAATTKKTRTSTQLDSGRSQVASIQSRLTDLTHDGKTDEHREEELKKLALAWSAAQAGLEEVEKKLAGFGGDPVAIVAKLEKQLDAADEASGKALEAEKIEEGRLQNLSAQGTYSNLAIIEEEIAALTDQARTEELRINAIRLLHDTMAQCHAETLSAVIGPVEAAATRTMQRITGERLGRLKLGESLEPDVVIPEISGEPVALKSGLSGGEKEQIHLATRLALADLLAKEERQLVVLDDVLTATDAGRLARVMTILEEAAQRLQILILTCHPERYRGLEGATFIDLEAGVRGGLET